MKQPEPVPYSKDPETYARQTGVLPETADYCRIVDTGYGLPPRHFFEGGKCRYCGRQEDTTDE